MFISTLQGRRRRNPAAHDDQLVNAPFFIKSTSNGIQKRAEQPFFTHTGSESNVQKKETGCAAYESNEIQQSHTQKGLLNSDAFIPGLMSLMNRQDDLVIADFGVDWGSVKESTRNEPFLQQWIYSFENNPEYWLEIEGYSDCSGFEEHNQELRQRRASKVYQLLDKARSRVKFFKAAPANEYISGNGNMEERAINRGVAIRFGRSFNLTGETLEGNRPKPPKPRTEKPPEKADTSDCDQNQKDALTRGFNLAKKMVHAALGEIDNDTLLKKYFGTDALKHRYHIKQNFVSIKDGLNSEPTFECEKADISFNAINIL